MTAQLVGVSANSQVTGGDKFRVTWTFAAASLLPSFVYNAPYASQLLQEWLPTAGFVPVSSPSAKIGDEVVVYDVRLAQTWGSGKTVAQVIEALEPPLSVTYALSVTFPLSVTKLEKLSSSLTSSQIEQGQTAAVEQGNTNANSNSVFETIGNAVGIAGRVVSGVVILALVVGIIYLARRD